MIRDLYNQYLKEHFDISDRQTRKCHVTINEDDQNQELGSLATK